MKVYMLAYEHKLRPEHVLFFASENAAKNYILTHFIKDRFKMNLLEEGSIAASPDGLIMFNPKNGGGGVAIGSAVHRGG